MARKSLTVLSLLLWVLTSGVATAATPPAKVVSQFIDAHLQGRFVEARGLTLEQIQLSASLFSNWLFGTGAAGGGDAATADIFLSRKFAQAFRYNVLGTTPSGDNQVYVTAVRASPNLVHLYTWALAPQRGAAPYALIEAVDTYLTKVNFPIEESRMEFTLIQEAGEWYISAIRDEKFMQLQTQWLSQQPLSVAATPPGMPPTSAPAASTAAPPGSTTATDNLGRQIADAQFNATLQGFNRPHQPPAAASLPPAQKADEDKPSFLGKVGRLFGFGGKESTTLARLSDGDIKKAFANIRDALARYSVSNGSVPNSVEIYDWKSLRQVVDRYGKKSLPTSEAEAGFSFVRYRTTAARDDYVLLLEIHEPQDGLKRVEVTAYGVDRAN
jgi:hypothetical protein